MNCQWIRDHVHSILDGEIPSRDRVAVEAHVTTCTRCARLLQTVSDEEAALRSTFKRPVAPDGFAGTVMARVSGPKRASHPGASRAGRRAWWPILTTAAAAVAIVYLGFRVLREPPPQPDSRASFSLPALPEKPAPVAATIAEVRGTAVFMPPDGGEWQRLSPGQELRLGSQVKTQPGGHVRAQLGDAVLSQIDENGLVRFTKEGLFLESGRVFSEVEPGRTGFVVTTANASATVKGTRFEVDHRSGNVTRLRVVRGTVELSNPEGTVAVGANMQAKATSGERPGGLMYADHLPALCWASVDEGSLDFAVGVALDARPGDVRAAIDGNAVPFAISIGYGDTRYGDLWLYCTVTDAEGSVILRQREQASAGDHRYRVKRVDFSGLSAGNYTARFRIGYGQGASTVEHPFTVQ